MAEDGKDGLTDVWCFGPFRLDRRAAELTRDGAAVAIEPQSLRLLEYLVTHRSRVVTRDEMIAAIWQRAAVTDWAIDGAIKALRVSLGDQVRPRAYVRTIRSRGVRFVADVTTETAESPPAAASVLVRDIRPLSDSAEDAYLADGLTEDLITDLARLTPLDVLSRHASRALTDPPAPHHGVAQMVEGTLRRVGDTVRITLSIRAPGAAHPLWAERFDFGAASLLAAQDQISLRVANRLVPGGTARDPRPVKTRDPRAYDDFLKGRYAYYRYDPKSFADALAHFEAATARDPGFAEAFAHQAYCRTAMYVFAAPGADKTLDPALALADRAIAADPAAAMGHARRGWALGYLGRPDDTIAAFEQALACDGDHAEVLYAYGETMNRLARPEQALGLLDRAFARDSFFPPSWEFAQGHSRALLGEWPRAIVHFEAVLARVPWFIPARVQLARTLHEAGQGAASRGQIAQIREKAPRYALDTAARMFPYPVAAERDRLLGALAAAGLT